MTTDKYERLGPILSDIGLEAVAVAGGVSRGVFLYSEVDEWGSVFASVFREDDRDVQYFDPSRLLVDLLYDAWDAEPADKRWVVMEYKVTGTRFSTDFAFPESLIEGEYVGERRQRALERLYGSKPIVYPPMPADWISTDD